MGTPNVENVRIGAVSVVLDGVNLGHSKDGVEFEFTREFEDLHVDKYGKTPVEIALTGNDLKVKLYLAEITQDNWAVANPEGEVASGDLGDRLGFGDDAGTLMSDLAGELVLHPLKNAANDYSEDIHVYKAVSVGSTNLGYKIDEQRIFELEMRAIVDETKPKGRRLGHVGPTEIS